MGGTINAFTIFAYVAKPEYADKWLSDVIRDWLAETILRQLSVKVIG
jgi:hypothetical protein